MDIACKTYNIPLKNFAQGVSCRVEKGVKTENAPSAPLAWVDKTTDIEIK